MLKKLKICIIGYVTGPTFVDSGGDVDVLVTSGKEVKYGPVKDAFQQVFGRATVNGMVI